MICFCIIIRYMLYVPTLRAEGLCTCSSHCSRYILSVCWGPMANMACSCSCKLSPLCACQFDCLIEPSYPRNGLLLTTNPHAGAVAEPPTCSLSDRNTSAHRLVAVVMPPLRPHADEQSRR